MSFYQTIFGYNERYICRDLSYNEISTIERDTFEFLEKLKKLKLDHNQITYIADGAFSSTPNLQILYV